MFTTFAKGQEVIPVCTKEPNSAEPCGAWLVLLCEVTTTTTALTLCDL